MNTNFDVNDLIKDYGNYYLNEGQNMSRLKAAIRQGSETLEKFATKIIQDNTVYRMSNPVFKKAMQPFRKAFEPAGGADFHPNEIIIRRCKADMEVDPTDFQATWLGFLDGGDATINMTTWPLIRYIIEKCLVEQIEEDRELDVVYNGVYDPDGTQPIDSFDGIKVQLLKGSTAKYPINIVPGIGQLDKVSIFDQIEKFCDGIPALLTKHKMIYFISSEYEKEFLRSKRAAGFYYISGPDQINNGVDFTKHVVCGLPSMTGTKDMFATLTPNLLWLNKGASRNTNIDIQKFDRTLHILTDWFESVGFACNKLVWATEHTVQPPVIDSGSGH